MIDTKNVQVESAQSTPAYGAPTEVLLAEDDPVYRQILHRWLESWGHRVTIAQDGLEAWQILQKGDAPRIIILDWMMPGMEGPELCRRIRAEKKSPSPYILLVTAKGGREDVIRGLEAGADDYIQKPCEADELRARVGVGQRMLKAQADLIEAREDLRFSATHDSLTGLWNHGTVLDLLEREIRRSARVPAPVGVLMVDIDHFKIINDTYGHLAGDSVLKDVSRRIEQAVRSYDIVGRYGGEEFVLVLPECHPEETQANGERIRQAVASTPIAAGGVDIDVTVSVGAASMADATSPNDLLTRADSALYRAKETGRDRTESYSKTRRWRRHKVDVPIRVILPRPSKTTIIDGRGYEVSEGGMAVTAGVELDVEDEIMIEFTPPYSGSPIRVRGTVRNRHGYRYGIEFLREGSKESEQVDHLRMMLSVMAKPE